MVKKYYKLLDIVRIVSCVSVFLYHLGYLKGGFLSVCTFFVLSGYLAYISLSKSDKVSLKDYYKKRFMHIYLPLLVVVFLTTCVASFIPSIHWFQLKPESTSVLLGYNNFWQLSVNADYFARHISSPFMHFWYIGILLQFEIIFPFIFIIIRFIKNKVGKIIPVFFLGIGIILSSFYFLNCNSVMASYYNSFARCFSLLLGVLVGYIHKEYSNHAVKEFNYFFYCLYLIVICVLQFLIDANSTYYGIIMILESLIACRLISYATVVDNTTSTRYDSVIKYLASISYEIYLFQYPVIFFFQYLNINVALKVFLIIITTILLSIIIHFCLDFKNKKYKILRIITNLALLTICLYGLYQYIIAKDYTNQMNDLKEQLSENEKLISAKQKDYEDRLKEENDNWNNVLNDLENGEKELSSYVTNLPIAAVGDSVMLGATPALYQLFPNGHFDAAVSRTDYEANKILLAIKNQNLLSDNVLIHLGTNGQCGLKCQKQIMATCGDAHVFLVTVSNDNDVHVNHTFYELEKMYSNITIIDWAGISKGHGEYFVADGVHLTKAGVDAYSHTIYDGIYNYYHQLFEEKRDKIIKEHEELLNAKIDFYGNHVLLNIYSNMQEKFSDSRFIVQDEYSINDLINRLKDEESAQTLAKNIVLAIDTPDGISIDEYKKIIDLCKDHNIYFLFIYHEPYSFDVDNVITLNFYKNIKENSDYLMIDGIHLSHKGNNKLFQFIQNEIKKKDN